MMRMVDGVAGVTLALLSSAAWSQATSPASSTVPVETPSSAAIGAVDPASPVSSAPPANGSSEAPAARTDGDGSVGEIIITAMRRASRLSDVPVAVSAITATSLRNTGATDLRQITQVVPSLLVSSSQSEAGASAARIRGVGTVGDNPGLESSVATFIDGVYRNRAGVALTELGPVDSVEVLRGPQGTLFGRNASAGLINITTAKPEDTFGGYGEVTYGNYDYERLAAGITGPIGHSGVDFRLDGVYNHRDGFLKDVISGRSINDRDRYLVRGKLKYAPSDALSILLIGDYTRQNEECCAATYLPARNETKQADGSVTLSPSTIAALERGFVSAVPGAGNGVIEDHTYARDVAITPGRSFRSDVRDGGMSAEIDYKRGAVALTSITAYRYNKYTSGQDSDFNNLDLLFRSDDGTRFQRFRTFTQEVRAQGKLFGDKLDWLVGGFYGHEKLAYNDNLAYGADYNAYATAIGAAGLNAVNPLLGPAFSSTGFANLSGFTRLLASTLLPATVPNRAAVIGALAAAVQNTPLTGAEQDRFRQTDSNYALFTHNIIHITNRLSATLGVRHTWDSKGLDADLSSTSTCGAYVANITRLRAFAVANPALAGAANTIANSVLAPLGALPCVINSVNGDFSGKRHESEWTGTGILSYKPTDRLLTYASYSKGYKAGGFNLDRAPFVNSATQAALPATDLAILQFKPEKVDAYEVGAKYHGHHFDVNVAGFIDLYRNFQLNTFSGTAFFVTNIAGCKDDLGTTDSDATSSNSACANTRSGLRSRGVEIESFVYPVRNLSLSASLALADTRYRKSLAGTPDLSGNNSLQPALSLLPGGRLSLSSKYVVGGSAQWTPPLGTKLHALAYADFRYTSAFHTASDLFPEKDQSGFVVVNARVGIGRRDGGWSLEAFARNLLNKNYLQTAGNAPIQGSNTSAAQLAAGQTSTQIYAAFLGEPRTYGLTARKAF